jgi:hypothetical protein
MCPHLLVCSCRWLQVKYAERTTLQCLTQTQLERSLTGPEFQLDTRYGEHLNVIYVTMLLSGGMPVAYITASIYFLASFWTEKFELLKLSRRPVAYGSDLAMMVANLMPYAVVRGRGGKPDACGGIGKAARLQGCFFKAKCTCMQYCHPYRQHRIYTAWPTPDVPMWHKVAQGIQTQARGFIAHLFSAWCLHCQ